MLQSNCPKRASMGKLSRTRRKRRKQKINEQVHPLIFVPRDCCNQGNNLALWKKRRGGVRVVDPINVCSLRGNTRNYLRRAESNNWHAGAMYKSHTYTCIRMCTWFSRIFIKNCSNRSLINTTILPTIHYIDLCCDLYMYMYNLIG